MTSTLPPRLGTAVLVLALVPSFSCGNRSASAADRAFVSAMIPHHHLGMRLIDEATAHSNDVRLRHLVFEMGNYHSSELSELDHWASSWKVSPAAEFPGEIPETSLSRLDTLGGVEHDIEWLALMIRHHEGALSLSHDVGAAESLPAVRTLASAIAEAQTQQIVEMRALLNELCGETVPATGCADVHARTTAGARP